MSLGRDWESLSPRTQRQYLRVLTQVYGRRVPGFVPDYEKLPESTRAILRAALQAYWKRREQPEKGAALAAQIKHGRRVQYAENNPSLESAEVFQQAMVNVEPVGAQLIAKLCFRRGFRIEEILSIPRETWRHGARYGRLRFIGKGNKERVLDVSNVKKTIEAMLALPGKLPHSRVEAARFAGAPEWQTPGQLLAGPGSSIETQKNLFARWVKRVAVEGGLDPEQWHPHSIRHVFATRQDERGASLHDLRVALGHERLSSTARYVHPTPERVARTFEGDD